MDLEGGGDTGETWQCSPDMTQQQAVIASIACVVLALAFLPQMIYICRFKTSQGLPYLSFFLFCVFSATAISAACLTHFEEYFQCCHDKTELQCLKNDLGLVHFGLIWIFTHLNLIVYVYFFQESVESISDPTWKGLKLLCVYLGVIEVIFIVTTVVLTVTVDTHTRQQVGRAVSIIATIVVLLIWAPSFLNLYRYRRIGNTSSATVLMSSVGFALLSYFQYSQDSDEDSSDLDLFIPMGVASFGAFIVFVYMCYILILTRRASKLGKCLLPPTRASLSEWGISSAGSSGSINHRGPVALAAASSLEDDEYLLLDEGIEL